MEASGAARRRRLRLRRRVLLGAAVVLGGAAWWWWSALSSGADVRWLAVERGDLVVGVDVEGTLASRDSRILTPPQVPGSYDFKISFMAPEGDEVVAGVPVLGFDTSGLQQQLLTLQNEADKAAKNIDKLDADQQQTLMELELQVAEAEARFGKTELKDDIPDDLRSSTEAQRTRIDLELQQMEVGSLEGQLEAARAAGVARREALVAYRDRAERLVGATQESIESMMVKAPRAGTVIYATNWREEKKKVGDSAWQRERIIELPDLTSMMARGEVDEADGGRIEEGQPVSLRLDAHPDVPYTARIESIWRTVQRKRNSRNPLKVVRLDLALDQTDTERMRPGMRFRGTIETQRVPDTLLIPTHAVFPTADGPVVFRRSLIGYDAVSVVLGKRNGVSVQVLEGLNGGDRVAESDPTR